MVGDNEPYQVERPDRLHHPRPRREARPAACRDRDPAGPDRRGGRPARLGRAARAPAAGGLAPFSAARGQRHGRREHRHEHPTTRDVPVEIDAHHASLHRRAEFLRGAERRRVQGPPAAGVRGDSTAIIFDELEKRVVPNMQRLQAGCRKAGIEVMYTLIRNLTKDGRDRSLDYKITGFSVPPGSWDGEVIDAIKPLDDEIVIPKTASNVFVSTNIDYVLRNLGTKYLVISGVVTDQCVEGAVRDGLRPRLSRHADHRRLRHRQPRAPRQFAARHQGLLPPAHHRRVPGGDRRWQQTRIRRVRVPRTRPPSPIGGRRDAPLREDEQRDLPAYRLPALDTEFILGELDARRPLPPRICQGGGAFARLAHPLDGGRLRQRPRLPSASRDPKSATAPLPPGRPRGPAHAPPIGTTRPGASAASSPSAAGP